ncbi:MAG: leucyl aminopeptidase family protein [Alphaproteobacteria bacterium]|nr:leucyl aminopeptidase family protein [Alphaproteobacteria bacterium]
MSKSLTTNAADAIAITPVAKDHFKSWLEDQPEAEREWLKANGFKGEAGKFVFLPSSSGRPTRVAVGADLESDPVWALALADALPEGHYKLDLKLDAAAATNVALGWSLSAYNFTRYKKPKREFATLVWPEHADKKEVEHLTRAIFLARDLINTPADDMGPPELAKAAIDLAKEVDAKHTVTIGDDLLKHNYPTIHAVGRAAAKAPCLIDLRWGDEKAPKVTLVGKGVCFDTGGLDLKGAANMLHMKKDMGGAATVLALASALMAAKTPIRLRVLIPAVENSVAGNAYHPRDIIKTRAGKTVEVGNTDAEGRLILCDALFEADSENPEILIDCATLTGAARVALGPEVQALFSTNDKLANDIVKAGESVADPIWRLPLWKPYRRMIDSKVADFNNVSGGAFGGAIIAAIYLAEFVKPTTPWAHLDIYASNEKARPGRPEGGDATGMRALYEVIRNRYA